MFSFFQPFKQAEQAALAPLLELARAKQGHARAAFLADLRVDAPTVVARLEAMLAAESGLPAPESSPTFSEQSPSGGPAPHPLPGWTAPTSSAPPRPRATPAARIVEFTTA